MTKDEIIKLIEDNGLTLHGDIEHFAALVAEHTYTKYLELPEAKQSGTISITMPAPIAYLCENATGHKYFRWKKPSSTYKPIPLYTTPPQQEPVRIMGFDCVCGRRMEVSAEQGVVPAPQRTWVGLTGGEVLDVLVSVDKETVRLPSMLGIFARAIEAAHGIKE